MSYSENLFQPNQPRSIIPKNNQNHSEDMYFQDKVQQNRQSPILVLYPSRSEPTPIHREDEFICQRNHHFFDRYSPNPTFIRQNYDYNQEEDQILCFKTKLDFSPQKIHFKNQYCTNSCQQHTKLTDTGLRNISERAYELALQMNPVTYKQIANQLMTELSSGQFVNDGKNQQNIKRRVYDALNVMISLGIVKKQGRKILGQIKHYKSCEKIKLKIALKEDYYKLSEQLYTVQKNIQDKSKKLADIKKKYQIISNLVKRNLQKSQLNIHIIPFPFIGTFIPNPNENFIIQNRHTISLSSTSKIKLFGDLDCLNFIQSLKQ